jgi:hypothetical protein
MSSGLRNSVLRLQPFPSPCSFTASKLLTVYRTAQPPKPLTNAPVNPGWTTYRICLLVTRCPGGSDSCRFESQREKLVAAERAYTDERVRKILELKKQVRSLADQLRATGWMGQGGAAG